MESRLVARVAEAVTLDRLHAAASAGSGAVVLITGEAGIGKTAVVEEFVSRAAAAGATVLTGRADPDEGAPAFWPWLRLLDCGLPGLGPETLATGGSGGTGGLGESPAAARFRAVRATVTALGAAAAGQDGGLILVLEDLHWADPASLTLLAALSREVAGIPVLVVATARTLDTDLPEAVHLALRPWDGATVADYLARRSAGPVHPTWPARSARSPRRSATGRPRSGISPRRSAGSRRPVPRRSPHWPFWRTPGASTTRTRTGAAPWPGRRSPSPAA